MKTLAVTFAVTCIVAMGGCVPKTYLTKPGYTEAQFQQDLAQCEYEARSATVNTQGAIYAAFEMAQLQKLCMKGKGYVETKAL